ncbi:MAG: FHA domain-containing protein [Planctomycetota bacterium]
MDREAFASQFKHPFLVLEVTSGIGTTDVFKTLEKNGGDNRPTEPVDKSDKTKTLREILAVPIVKSSRNSFHNMITLGRASNNDVVVEHASVSKFHAYFRVDPSTMAVSVADAGSSYGTVVDGKSVGKDEAASLKSGAILRFAESVRSTFLSPAEFFDYMAVHLKVSQ